MVTKAEKVWANEDMFREYQETGDESIKEEFFYINRNLSHHLAKSYSNTNLDYDDLVAIANFGMVKAFNSFKVDKGLKFITYASRCMENEILMALRKSKKYKGQMSLETPLSTDKDGSELLVMEIISSQVITDIDKADQRMTFDSLLDMARERLEPRDFMILENLILDSDDEDRLTQRELSQILNISQSYVSRLEGKVSKLIRRFGEEKGFIESHEYSGTGLLKVSSNKKPEKYIYKPEVVEEYPVVTYYLKSTKGDVDDMKQTKKRTLKDQIKYYMKKHPEMDRKDIAKEIGKPATSVGTYMSLIRKEWDMPKMPKGPQPKVPKVEIPTAPKTEIPKIVVPKPIKVEVTMAPIEHYESPIEHLNKDISVPLEEIPVPTPVEELVAPPLPVEESFPDLKWEEIMAREMEMAEARAREKEKELTVLSSKESLELNGARGRRIKQMVEMMLKDMDEEDLYDLQISIERK